MARHVILMRHAQSEANAGNIWQGASSSPLSAAGRRQAAQAAPRLAGRQFTLVESSDLERSVHTARIAGFEPEQRPVWREGNIGEWEDLDGDYLQQHHAAEIARLHHDYDMPMGVTGESLRQVAERGWTAVQDLADRLDEGQTALVVTHGGLIGGLLARVLGLQPGRRRLGFLSNTSACHLTFDGNGGAALVRYNDAAHLGPVTHWAEHTRSEGGLVVDLIRHGVTHANLERRVQGQRDSGLHPTGRQQASRLAGWIGDVDEVFSSSLGRAMTTAEIAFGRPAIPVDELREIDLGDWEGHLWGDLEAEGRLDGYPHHGMDTPRGSTGETWAEVQERVAGFLNALSATHARHRVAATSHGGAIKAYAASILGFGFDRAGLLGPLGNTSVTQVAISPEGHPMLTTYNITRHLED